MRIFNTLPSAEFLQHSIFVYPTETCYGLGCDATQESLVKRIYEIKKRDSSKFLSWIVKDIAMAEQYVTFSKKELALAENFWPGSFTLVLPRKKSVAIPGNHNTIALRVSAHPIATAISSTLGKPIIATSANLSGNGECYDVDTLCEQFSTGGERPDGIIDVGTLPHTQPTTVARVRGDEVEIIRQGEITLNPDCFL
jgi:L-threonylcarbamoyladenylate synthase